MYIKMLIDLKKLRKNSYQYNNTPKIKEVKKINGGSFVEMDKREITNDIKKSENKDDKINNIIDKLNKMDLSIENKSAQKLKSFLDLKL